MTASLQRILFAIAASLVAVDIVWGIAGHFQMDVIAYGRLGALSLALLAAGLFYQIRRGEPAIAAMLLGACFLCAFSAAAGLLNHFLLTVHGPRIDAELAAADRAMGFDWVAIMTAMAAHPLLNRIFFFAYNSVLPQIALMSVLLGLSGNTDKTYRFGIAIASSALISILAWAAAPSFGAMSVEILPPDVARSVFASVDGAYGKVLVTMLRDGPGYISPANMRGLIGFPSYHAALALIVIWYARDLARLFWPLLIVNIVVLLATPVQGGHHLVDVLAAFPVACIAIFLSRLHENAQGAVKLATMVNKAQNSYAGTVPSAFFRASAGQKRVNVRPAIKSKLSGVS